MKRILLPWLCCPECRSDLTLAPAAQEESAEEIETGTLTCSSCGKTYPIKSSIPRFVPPENYASNFGFQWNHFRQTQLDSYSGTTISRDRFLKQTGWTREMLEGASVLDVGCGAGRFTEIALSLGAQVYALDYSNAVDACRANFPSHPNLHLLQADIYRLPLRPEQFDFVYCLGVLQHTPNPHKALAALPPFLKPGGRIVVDFYLTSWKGRLHPKEFLRPLTRRMPGPTLFKLIERGAPPALRLSRAVGRIPLAGKYLRYFVPVANYEGVFPLDDRQLREWAILDTFDWLAPAYDNPQTPKTLAVWLKEAGLEDVEVQKVNHLVGRGRRPSQTLETHDATRN